MAARRQERESECARDLLRRANPVAMHSSIRGLRSNLFDRVGRGEHLILYGPRGGGKSTLVSQLHARFAKANTPCGVAQYTSCLDDITRTMESAYPEVNIQGVSRRTARARLWSAADRRGCVLLLDHLTKVSTVLVGFCRRLRGGIAGILFVIDVDVERERQRMRAKRLALSVRMPPVSTRQVRTLLRSRCAEHHLTVALDMERQILRAAQGRPGWIVQCTTLMPHSRYWHDGQLYPTLLCTDTEITLRQGHLRLLAPDADRASAHVVEPDVHP
jgi:energy-coupling factor transporter ATP-binding protein EcfA2